jgi:D-aminopeptidase
MDPHRTTPSGLPRARGLGINFDGTPGPHNAITDVPGVEVGYVTIIEGDSARTGVTAIHPRGKHSPSDPCAAGVFSLNGNGELTGQSWINESGTFAGPIAITNTHAVGVAHAGIVAWMAYHFADASDGWLLPVVGETWDGYLNDINAHHVHEHHMVDALDAAAAGPIDEGSVGGGTGMNCYDFKGGTGTASRLVEIGGETFTVGVLLQCNFGSRRDLVINGVNVGTSLSDNDPIAEHFAASGNTGAGSVIAIVLTDAPLLPHQCSALARRVSHGLARTGTYSSHFSGDIFLAASVANPGVFAPGSETLNGRGDPFTSLRSITWGFIDPLYEAVVQATQEAVLNSMVANTEMIGRNGHRSPALPHDRVTALLGLGD